MKQTLTLLFKTFYKSFFVIRQSSTRKGVKAQNLYLSKNINNHQVFHLILPTVFNRPLIKKAGGGHVRGVAWGSGDAARGQVLATVKTNPSCLALLSILLSNARLLDNELHSVCSSISHQCSLNSKGMWTTREAYMLDLVYSNIPKAVLAEASPPPCPAFHHLLQNNFTCL